MSANIKTMRAQAQAGFTIAELMIATAIIGLLIVPAMLVILYFYGATIQNSAQAQLAVESQNVLRSIVEELRVSSGVRDSNTITDPNEPSGGWTTSNASLVLIISSPATDLSNNYITDPNTGGPYQNELVYFATGGTLYKRYLANSGATGNRNRTSCPAASASSTCPADIVLSNHFKTMTFTFYDQDGSTTTTLANARSVLMDIQMEEKVFGRTMNFQNKIRVTLRNNNT